MNKQQIAFLFDELGITEDALEKMTAEQRNKVREDCFDIEVEEACEADKDGDREISERGAIATSIVDALFSGSK